MNEIYIQEKALNQGDKLFWAIVNVASPKSCKHVSGSGNCNHV